MRSLWRLCAAMLLALLAGGCDTTQPQQFDQQTFEISVLGVNSHLSTYNTWKIYEDVNKNGVQDPDEPDYLFCEDLGAEMRAPQSAPFPFSVEISRLPAGGTTWVPVTSNDATSLTANLTLYDFYVATEPPPAVSPIKQPIVLGSRTFRFLEDQDDRRQLSSADREVVEATYNPLSALDPATYGFGSGLCSLSDPGEAKIDNQPQPMALTLNKGDTIKVELRRGLGAPEGVSYTLEPLIQARLILDGRVVTDASTTRDPDAPLTLTYTFR